jgi:hypothetical protein
LDFRASRFIHFLIRKPRTKRAFPEKAIVIELGVFALVTPGFSPVILIGTGLITPLTVCRRA